MSKASAQVTAAEISRLADVTRATVSNWRRRHRDFPSPTGGTDASPLYDLEAVREWLRARGKVIAESPSDVLDALLRLGDADRIIAPLMPLVLAAARHGSGQLAAWQALSDDELAARTGAVAAELAEELPDAAAVNFQPGDASVLRALLRCVQEDGARKALNVLALRKSEDRTSPGAYTTPRPMSALMAQLLPPGTRSVLDPACGRGRLLHNAARQGARELYGQDISPWLSTRAAVGLLLEYRGDARVTTAAGDSLRADAFPDLTADAVLCNPPFGDRDWGHDELAYDSRWAYGVPPRSESELAWVQHALTHLVPGGLAVMLLPPAVASRTSGRRVRTELVRSGALRAVVELPRGLTEPHHIGMHLWLLQRPEPGGPEQGSVLFVDASEDDAHSRHRSRREGQRSPGWGELTSRVVGAWQSFTDAAPESASADEPGVTRTVPLLDLVDDLVDLTPSRQVRSAHLELDPAEVARQALDSQQSLKEQAAGLVRAADLDIWRPADGLPPEWRTATVSDLARGGALEIQRATPRWKDTAGTEHSSSESGPLVLTPADLRKGRPATGHPSDQSGGEAALPVIAEGDVVMRESSVSSGPASHVADAEYAGALLGRGLFLLRPDPARLDSHFLAGFVGTEDNIASASTGTTTVQVQPGRLRVPLIPLGEQRKYGEAFERIAQLRAVAHRADELAREASRTIASGLTSRTLLPPEA